LSQNTTVSKNCSNSANVWLLTLLKNVKSDLSNSKRFAPNRH
jgi:hypothetical protein